MLFLKSKIINIPFYINNNEIYEITNFKHLDIFYHNKVSINKHTEYNYCKRIIKVSFF